MIAHSCLIMPQLAVRVFYPINIFYERRRVAFGYAIVNIGV